MKQKIVLRVPMHNEKDKSKAMQIVVSEEGVSSVSIGKDEDLLEVIGEGVDSVCLARSLRKKFCFALILTVGEVMPAVPPPPPPLQDVADFPPSPYLYPSLPHFQVSFNDPHIYDNYPTHNDCSIL